MKLFLQPNNLNTMDSLIIFGIFALLVLVVVLPYIIKVKRKEREVILTKNLAADIGSNRPVGDHPLINISLCIGCSSCVDACPEHALGLVKGRSELIYPAKCVGHSICRDACPVGAISITREANSKRSDVPIHSENMESNIPNLFVIGELSGLALIKNAVTDAIQVINYINSLKEKPNKILIIGSGPAGLTAGLACVKHKLNYEILEQNENYGGTIYQYPRRKLVMTSPLEFPTGDSLPKLEYRKEQLLEIWQKLYSKHKLNVRFNSKVTAIHPSENGIFTLDIENQPSENADFVILALGRRGSPRKLNVEGENLPKVSYSLIDAGAYTNSHILIVGGGDSAVEAALALSISKSNKVTVSYRKSEFSRIKARNQERVNKNIDSNIISVIWNSEVTFIGEDFVRLKTETDEVSLKNDAVFIFIGGELPWDLLKKAGVKFGGE